MSARVPQLSVVVPVYDEIATVEALIEEVESIGLDLEIVVVDDGSTDGTAEVLAKLAHEGRIKLETHEHNQGKGAALRTGFAVVRGEFVAVQDADLEYDPHELAKLIGPLVRGKADVVYGSRFVGSEPHRVLYFWHYVTNRGITLLSNVLTNLNLTDIETCYKAFRRDVIQAVTIEEDRFGFEPEITAKVARMGCRVYEVGISYSGRTYSEGKKIGWRDGVRAIWCILKYNLRRSGEERSGEGR